MANDIVLYDEAFVNGVVRDTRRPRSTMELESLSGLLPTENRLRALLAIDYPLTGTPTQTTLRGDLWPYPNMLNADPMKLLFAKGSVYKLTDTAGVLTAAAASSVYPSEDPATTPTTIADDSTGTNYTDGAWQAAGFAKDVWIATNGYRFVFETPQFANPLWAGEVESPGGAHVKWVTAQTVCNHLGRMVVGGLAGTWFSSDEWEEIFDCWRNSNQGRDYREDVITTKSETLNTSWIAWSERGGGDTRIPYVAFLAMIGALGDTPDGASTYYATLKEYIFTAIEQGTMGFMPCRKTGPVVQCKTLGGDLVVYGQEGVSFMQLTDGGYRESMLPEVSCYNRQTVCGDEYEHVFMARNGGIYRLRPGKAPEGPYWQDIFSAKTTTNGGYLFVYDPVEAVAIITCPGAESPTPVPKAWWITQTGLSRGDDIRPTSLFRVGKDTYKLYGTWYQAASTSAATFKTLPFDAGQRDPWTIQQLRIASADTAAHVWKAAVHYRIKKTGTWRRLPADTDEWFTFDERGIALVKALVVDYQIELTCDDRTVCALDRLEVVPGYGKASIGGLLS